MPLHKCLHCDYISDRRSNLERHALLKHPNATPTALAPTIDGATCLVCGRTFAAKWYARKHAAICDGVADPLECPRCHRRFASAVTKCRHLKAGCDDAAA